MTGIVNAPGQYVQELGDLLQLSGRDRLKRLLEPETVLMHRLARIHPRVWGVMSPADLGQPDPRGPRRFPAARPSQISSCEASRLTPGSVCSLPWSECQLDHVWPYSLGGPTVPGNRAVLCATHNQIKAAFVLLTPDAPPDWLEPLETRLEMLATSALRSGVYLE